MAEFDLTAEITSVLKDWSGDIADGLDELVDEESKALKQDIVNDSPERTGDYKKGWKIKKERNTDSKGLYIVYRREQQKFSERRYSIKEQQKKMVKNGFRK